MSFMIGNVEIPGDLVLGPMAGVTDLPFRLLCKEFGADLIYTEMVSAKGIMYNNKNTVDLLKTQEEERPVALQLFGSDPDILGEMAAKIEHLNFDIVDVNMGCPVPKIVNNHEGSALMDNPKLIGKIVKSISTHTSKPVTIKIRKCFRPEKENAVEIAQIAQENGAAAIAVHPRSRQQYYSGEADWDVIAKVKEAVTIPVIGNGDVDSIEDYISIKKHTGCDGVMIARGAKGNPWIFRQIKEYNKTGVILPKPDIEEVIEVMLRHAKMMVEFKGENMAMREMRKHVAWYTAGYPDSSKLRGRINEIETLEDITSLMKEYHEKIRSHVER